MTRGILDRWKISRLMVRARREGRRWIDQMVRRTECLREDGYWIE
jgi:hypothetical protein